MTINVPSSGLKFSDNTVQTVGTDYWRANRVVTGLMFSAPTTPSTQGSGAVKAVWRVNRSSGLTVSSNVAAGIYGNVEVSV